jgi:uncharacterized protein YaiL (DUF2058 family)
MDLTRVTNASYPSRFDPDCGEETMGNSLRDQLIKTGLATADQARKAERKVRAEKHAQRQGNTPPGGKAVAQGAGPGATAGTAAIASAAAGLAARARQLNAEKAERDRELQRAVNEKAAAKALRAELKQLIQRNDQRTKPHDGDVPYNFLHGRKVKRIYVTREHQAKLSSGTLVIVNDDGRYHLVADSVAERVRARDPRRIIAAHGEQPAEPGADDDYYARFKVPDDLDW